MKWQMWAVLIFLASEHCVRREQMKKQTTELETVGKAKMRLYFIT